MIYTIAIIIFSIALFFLFVYLFPSPPSKEVLIFAIFFSIGYFMTAGDVRVIQLSVILIYLAIWLQIDNACVGGWS